MPTPQKSLDYRFPSVAFLFSSLAERVSYLAVPAFEAHRFLTIIVDAANTAPLLGYFKV